MKLIDVMYFSTELMKQYHPYSDKGRALRKAVQILLGNKQLTQTFKAGQRKKESQYHIRVKAFVCALLEAANIPVHNYMNERGLFRRMPLPEIDEYHNGSICTEEYCVDCKEIYTVRPHPFHQNVTYRHIEFTPEVKTQEEQLKTLIHRAAKIQGFFGVDLHLKPDFSSLETVMDAIVEKLSIFTTEIDWKHLVISFLLCVTTVWFNFDRPTTIIMAISQFVMNLKLRDDLLKAAIDFFYSLFLRAQEAISTIIAACSTWCMKYSCGVPGVKVQGNNELPFSVDVTPLIPVIGGACTALFSLAILKQLPGGDKFQTTFDRFSKMSGIIRSYHDIEKIGSEFFTHMWDSISFYVFGVERPVMDEWKNINAWIAEVNCLITPDFESDIKNNEQLKNTVETLIQRGLNILRMLDMLKMPMSERQSIQTCMMFLMRARETAASCGAGQTKPRVAPAIIHFYGDSGVGKSTTLWAMIAEIQAALGVTKPSDLHEKTYFRRPGGEFWDGYSNGMNVVVCDDFGAIKDNAQAPNEEFLEAIHMSNTAFWQLNMADLKDKGNTYFQAKCVLWTSNKSHFAVTSLTNPEAVIRRIDLKIRQRPHPNFEKNDVQNGRTVKILDPRKVNQAIVEHGKNAMLKCVVFDIIDKLDANDKVLESGLDFWEVAQRCTDLVLRNVNHFEDFNKVLGEHTADAIERCKDGKWKPAVDDFNPNNFNPKVEGFGDFLRGVVQETTDKITTVRVHTRSHNYEHIDQINLEGPDDIDEDDLIRLRELKPCGNDPCFEMPNNQVKAFMTCFDTANTYINNLPEYERTEDMFANLFRQCELKYGTSFSFKRVDGCCVDENLPNNEYVLREQENGRIPDQSFLRRFKRSLHFTKVRLDNSIQQRFGLSPLTFFSVVGVSTALIGMLGFLMYRKIFKRIETMTIESYDQATRTNGKKKSLLAEALGYEKPNSRVQKKVLEAAYSADAAKARPKTKKIEGPYSQEVKGKQLKKVFESKVEGCSGCSACGKELSRQHCNGPCCNCKGVFDVHDKACAMYPEDKRNILEKVFDFGANFIPQGPYGRERCIHGNVKGLCFYCKDLRVEGASVQAIVDQNAAEVVSCLYKNMYKLEYWNGDKWQHAMNLLVVKGRLAIVNRHLLIYKDFQRWRIRNQNFSDGIEFPLGKCACSYAPDDKSSPYAFRDVMMIELPKLVHQHKDITSKFMTGDDFARFSQLQQVSVIGYIPNENISMRQYFGSDVEADDSVFPLEYPNSEEIAVTVRSLIKYNIQTTGGDCGAVLVAFDKNFSNKIFGIHCAGMPGSRFQGFGTPTSRGHLDYLERNLNIEHSSSLMYPGLECFNETQEFKIVDKDGVTFWKTPKILQGNFYPIGKDSKPVFNPSTTKIVPSPVHGVIQEPTMAPAILRPREVNGVVVDPMANARVKASPISPPIDDQILLESSYHFYQKVSTTKSDDKKLLTYEQSITGIAEDPCYPHMKRSTSPGYGWDKTGPGKTKWLGTDGDFVVDHPELKERALALLAECKKGKRPNTIWTDTLKDERRTLDKVKACKTRLFSCGEMAYTLIFRMYFAGFIAHMTRNKIDFESCVGVNVYSLEWNKIAQTLKQVGDNVLAGDFANYDGTLHPDILWAVCDLINNWYDDGEDNRTVRIALWSEIVNSIHIVEDNFYMWNHSQPSGCPMTTILNCVYHSISARYVYILCARKSAPLMTGLENFDQYVRHVNYGDDDVWSIHPEILGWFNQLTITEAYKEIGMTYTDEAKTGNIVASRSLGDIDFLKRKFRWDTLQCRYRAPLSLATIKEMAMWNHSTIDQYPQTASVLQDAVRELAQHDEHVFNLEFPAFQKAATLLEPKAKALYKPYSTYQNEEYTKILEQTQ